MWTDSIDEYVRTVLDKLCFIYSDLKASNYL